MDEIKFCKCLNPNMINTLSGIDLNCYECGNEVPEMRENFKRAPYYDKYIEVKNGVFEKK